MAGAEGPGRAGVAVLRLWAAASQTPHLAVRPVHHLDKLSHSDDAGGGKQEGSEILRINTQKQQNQPGLNLNVKQILSKFAGKKKNVQNRCVFRQVGGGLGNAPKHSNK